jgi:gliding motility-associated-like protein
MWLRTNLLFIMLVVSPFISMGQLNLINNPSFEDQLNCPVNAQTTLINNCNGWFTPLRTTPDCFNPCGQNAHSVPLNSNGYQYPKSGQCYAGIINSYRRNNLKINYREYIETKLQSPLINNENYEISMFVTLADKSKYICNSIGIYFSTDSIYDPSCLLYCYLSLTPQLQFVDISNTTLDSSNWTRLSFNYQANGTERYIIIGNFLDSLSTVDSLVNWGSPEEASYIFIDDIFVGNYNIPLPNIITPNGDVLNDFWQISDDRISQIKFSIYNRWGELVSESNDNEKSWNGKTINGDNVSDGIYFYNMILVYKDNSAKNFRGTIQVLYNN